MAKFKYDKETGLEIPIGSLVTLSLAAATTRKPAVKTVKIVSTVDVYSYFVYRVEDEKGYTYSLHPVMRNGEFRGNLEQYGSSRNRKFEIRDIQPASSVETEATGTENIWVGTVDTGHYEFTAYGKTKAEVTKLLKAGWAKHVAAYPMPHRLNLWKWDQLDPEYEEVTLGECYRK